MLTGQHVTTVSFASLSRDEMRDCLRIWRMVWPKEDENEEPVTTKISFARNAGQERRDEQVHILRNGHSVKALARSFIRRIGTEDGDRDVLALASVCTDPALRGHGLGRCVVEAAFARLGPQLPVALFQTQVPGFYEKMGSRRIANRIINSHEDGRTFWDPVIMIHPGDAPWSDGTIDLRGPPW